MRIVIDARMYGDFGIGRYNRNLIKNLQKIDQKNEYFILHKRDEFKKINYEKNFTKILADFHWYGLTEQYQMLFILKSIKPDLVHIPHFNVPLFYSGKFVVTIHDLTHQYFQMRESTTHSPVLYKLKQIGYKAVFKKAVTKSVKIFVPSNYVKELLREKWMVEPGKILVTEEGVDENIIRFEKEISNLQSKTILQRFNIAKDYLFYVGNAHPHKNIEGLIRAFLTLHEKHKNLYLVMAGKDDYFWQKLKGKYPHEQIIYLGNVTDQELVALYKNASVFVMPSFEEGFGIPLLEAMACSCPVVASNAGSLKEVGGDAANYFDPKSEEMMVLKISEVLNDQKMREDLIKKGLERVKKFSWEKLARQTLEGYLECV